MELNINSPAYFKEHYGVEEEVYRFLNNKSVVSIFIRMDFESYYHADSMEKLKQTKEMILTAVKRIKSRGKLDYHKFVEDFLSLE